MKFNLAPIPQKPKYQVHNMLHTQWFKINGCHFIRMDLRDGELRDYGSFVEENCRVYDKNFLIGDDTGNVIPCLNLEEQMLVYVDCGIIVDDYGDYEMNLFRK